MPSYYHKGGTHVRVCPDPSIHSTFKFDTHTNPELTSEVRCIFSSSARPRDPKGLPISPP